MTYSLVLQVPGLTADRYAAVVEELADRRLWPPAERVSHVCTETADGVEITEVWATRAAADRFIASIFAVLDREDIRVVARDASTA